MKKKGFSLIELLAVIIILAVLALIVTPIITKVIEGVKRNSLKISAEGIIEASKYSYALTTDEIDSEIIYSCSNNKCIANDKEINYNGKIDNGILVIKNKKEVGICVDKDGYYALKNINDNELTVDKGNCSSYNDGNFIIENDNDILYKRKIDNLLANNAISWEFRYMGEEENIQIPITGTYKLEVWGAQGGSYNDTYIGGYGGYSKGNIELNQNDIVYVNVGGAGKSGDATTSKNYGDGGYNGGGSRAGWSATMVEYKSSGGGGATHIALRSGLLESLKDYQIDLLIVAGAGGGNGYTDSGANSNSTRIASGGGVAGVLGNGATNKGGRNGTQEEADWSPFGKGTNCGSSGVCDGGGAGYYGGGSGTNGAGGGSGYIGNDRLKNKIMYTYCVDSNLNDEVDECAPYKSNNISTKTEITTNVSDAPISTYAKKGNGYAKITLVSLPSNINNYKALYERLLNEEIIKWDFPFIAQEETFKIPVNGIYKLEVWGAQGGSYNDTYIGGYGGYSKGNIELKKNDIVYVNVGGEGKSGDASTSKNYGDGGYNGGGTRAGWNASGVSYKSSGGGGATHIALRSGLLESLKDYQTELLIVAGGGGGNGYTNAGNNSNSTRIASGGGISGVYGNGASGKGGVPGTQNIAAWSPFGKGQSCGSSGVCDGGGAGYYGGASGLNGAGGGSGYIGHDKLKDKIMYTYCIDSNLSDEIDECAPYKSNVTSTKTDTTTNVSNNPISTYAKKGNGYARITYIGE